VIHIHIWNFLILGEEEDDEDDHDDGLLLEEAEDPCADPVDIDIGCRDDIGCLVVDDDIGMDMDMEGIDMDVVVDDDDNGTTEERFGLGDTGIISFIILDLVLDLVLVV